MEDKNVIGLINIHLNFNLSVLTLQNVQKID